MADPTFEEILELMCWKWGMALQTLCPPRKGLFRRLSSLSEKSLWVFPVVVHIVRIATKTAKVTCGKVSDALKKARVLQLPRLHVFWLWTPKSDT